MEKNSKKKIKFNDYISNEDLKKRKYSDEKSDISQNLNDLFSACERKDINKENYRLYQEKLSGIEPTTEIESKIYYKISFFLQNIEFDVKTDKISEELERKTIAIKSEILGMMGLFFTVFTFVQVNFTFSQKFFEEYSGYKLIFYVTLINIILIVILSFIMEIIGAIVYGENRARIKDLKEDGNCRNYWIFPESKLKIKRSFAYSLIFLLIIASFSFFMGKMWNEDNGKRRNVDKEPIKNEINLYSK